MDGSKPTLILGASTNTQRISLEAIRRLTLKGEKVFLIGNSGGEAYGQKIYNTPQPWQNVHTVNIYLNAFNQKEYYNYIIDLKPKRVIFNPGSENYELMELCKRNNIETEVACTLVLLSLNQY